MHKRIIPGVILVFIMLSGCVSVTTVKPDPHRDKKPHKHRNIGRIKNNSHIRLQAAGYLGNFVISQNKVTISGKGRGKTIIYGNVTITGNGCFLRDLTVTGNVHIRGNNNRLEHVSVKGRVTSNGKNNKW
ncbi:MAG: hypothetical protein JW969_02735 [Spirochaetales bacterium]|nr:hypothetical protein [Spirochaetales bacterium]